MADLYASRAPVRLNDGSADANNAVVTNAAPVSTDYALEVRQVGIPAAAVLADGVSNPTLTSISGYLFGYNGTTWDRLRSTTANGLAVDVTRVTGTVTVDTELPAAAALADAAANATTPTVGAAGLVYNGSTWDRAREVVAAQDTTGTGIAAAGVLAQLDDVATTTVTENQFAPLRLSTRRALLIEGVTSGTNVNVNLAASAATVTVDSELPAAAALADAASNPTVPGVGGFLMGYNGTTWDRVRTANTGRLQVDVVTGGGSPPASGVPSGYNLTSLYGTSAGVAAGATQTAVVTVVPVNLKTQYVQQAAITASGQIKGQVKFGATVLATIFNSQTALFNTVIFSPPLTVTGDGATALTIDITNREASAMDVYATLRGYVLQ